MWERISAVDIEDAKAQLSRRRGETLSRQAEEIKSLDTQLHDIESFERVVAAFFEEYMNSKVPSVPAASVPEQSVSFRCRRAAGLLPKHRRMRPPWCSKFDKTYCRI